MIKKYLGIAGVVAAVSVSLAACGGAGGAEQRQRKRQDGAQDAGSYHLS